MPISLILGGARSGKSRRAEALALDFEGSVTYVATSRGDVADPEWAIRVAAHRARRPATWRACEIPFDLPDAIERECAASGQLVLVDCLTLWLSNWMELERSVEEGVSALERSMTTASGELILVSNEVGSGVVPPTPLGRRFRDEQGRLNQRIAALADRVELLVAGIPVLVKGNESHGRA